MVRSRGVTLIELMVGMFLGSIMLLLLVRLFQVGLRTGREEIARGATESSLVLTLNRIERDLLSSTPAGISLDSAGNRLLVHPILSVTNRRQVVYEDRFLYWSYDAGSEHLFGSESLTPPSGGFNTLAQRLSSAELGALPLTGTSRVFQNLSGITTFSVSNPAGVQVPLVGSPLTIVIEGRVEEARTRGLVRLEKIIYLASGAS